VARVRALAGAEVVDESPRMLVVEADAGPLAELVEDLGDWIAAPDGSYPVPDTRRQVERPPD
jgi:hypothetical protein